MDLFIRSIFLKFNHEKKTRSTSQKNIIDIDIDKKGPEQNDRPKMLYVNYNFKFLFRKFESCALYIVLPL